MQAEHYMTILTLNLYSKICHVKFTNLYLQYTATGVTVGWLVHHQSRDNGRCSAFLVNIKGARLKHISQNHHDR